MAAKEVTDRVEGKARQAVDIGLEPMPDFNLRVCFIKSCALCCGKGLKHCPNCGDQDLNANADYIGFVNLPQLG